jgi:hypothetical protein
MRALALPVIGFALIACGGSGKEASGDPAVAATPTATAPASAEPGPASAPEQEAPKKKRKPYEIVNLCPNVVTLIFGTTEDPKAPNNGSRTLGGNGRIDDGPRDPDGNQRIWLMVRDTPLVTVHVSRATKRIEIGTSCDTLEMH